MFWVNGQPASMVSLSDRSFQYGDGCFTTILTKSGEIQRWPLHIARMQACLDLLAIQTPCWEQVETWLEAAALKNDEFAGLKLHISRGEGGRGYNPSGIQNPNVTVSHFTYPDHYFDWQQKGIELGICKYKLGIMPLLAGHKHNNRLEQVLLRGELEQSGFQDGIVIDINDNVAETTMANLFWLKEGVLYTPCMMSCGVAGITRQFVIAKAQELGVEVVIGQFTLDHLSSASEIFITNAILGIAPVQRIQDSSFPIGAITRRFQECFNS